MGTREDVIRFAFINRAVVAGVKDKFAGEQFAGGQESNVETVCFQARPDECYHNGKEESHLINV